MTASNNDQKATNLHSIVIEAVQYLASNEEELSRFFAITGMDAQDLASNIAQAPTQAGLLEFFINHEPSLLAFCANKNIEPEQVVKLCAILAGDQNFDHSI